MTLTRRSLLASLGIALPAALSASGAKAATAPTLHRHKRRHAHTASTHTHHHKPHRTTTSAVRQNPPA